MMTTRTYRGNGGIADFAFASLGISRFTWNHDKYFIDSEYEAYQYGYTGPPHPIQSIDGDFDLVYHASRIEDVTKTIGRTIALTLRTSCGLVLQGPAIIVSVKTAYDDFDQADNKYRSTLRYKAQEEWRLLSS